MSNRNELIPLKIDGEELIFAGITNRENLEAAAVCKSGSIFTVDLESREN